jgi:uncharacterized membrane protein YqhA
MLQRILAGSRYLVIIAVIGSFLASLAVLVYGGVTVLGIVFNVFTHGTFTAAGGKDLAIECIELIDLFLLGIVLDIIALGLYELFIDERLPMPSWLVITDLDDLKAKLLGVITVLLAVTFLANVVTWNGNVNILALGVAVGLVLFALAYFTSRNTKAYHVEKRDEIGVERGTTPLKED